MTQSRNQALIQPDILVAALALPVFLLAGWPLLGWGAAVVIWILQRLAQVVIQRRATESDDPRAIVGLTAGSMLARGWLVAISIFLVGLAEREAGLAAAVLVVSLFTVYFATQLATRPFADREARP